MKFRAVLNDDYDLEDMEPFVFKPWMRTAVFFAVWIIVLNVCAVLYVTLGDGIYFGDTAIHWDIAKNIAHGVVSSNLFGALYKSICTMSNNHLAALPSALCAYLFGDSRTVYVLSLVNFYAVPYLALVYYLARKIGKAPKITSSLIMLLMPIVPFAAFIGFADIGGIVICMACYALYYTKRGEEQQMWRYVLIGVLLVLMMLWRSCYAFFAVSFATAMIADVILFKRKWYYTAVSIIIATAIIVLFFRDFVFNIMITGYGSADYMAAAGVDFKLLTRYFGIIFLLGAAVCSVLMGVYKKEKRAAFLWIQTLVCFIMFMSVRSHSQEDLLMYVPPLAVLCILIIKYISKEWMLVAIGVLAAAQSVNVCIPRETLTSVAQIRFCALIPNFSMLPNKRSDAHAIEQLKKTLDGIVGEGETLGVIASSTKLNSDILCNVETSLGAGHARVDYIKNSPQISDLTQNIDPLFNYDYILAAFPALTSSDAAQSAIIIEAVSSFLNWTDFATAYEELYDYATVIDDVTVKIYKRVKTVTDEYKYAFAARLYQY